MIRTFVDQYEAFVKVSLKSRVGKTDELVDSCFMQYYLYVLKEEAIVFHTQLMNGLLIVLWRRGVDHQLLPDDEAKAVPKSWAEVKLALECTKPVRGRRSAFGRRYCHDGNVLKPTLSRRLRTNTVTSFPISVVKRNVPESPSWKL